MALNSCKKGHDVLVFGIVAASVGFVLVSVERRHVEWWSVGDRVEPRLFSKASCAWPSDPVQVLYSSSCSTACVVPCPGTFGNIPTDPACKDKGVACIAAALCLSSGRYCLKRELNPTHPVLARLERVSLCCVLGVCSDSDCLTHVSLL